MYCYSVDGMNCADNDECANETDNCDLKAACANNKGSFESRYSGDGKSCTDDDEFFSGDYT